MLTERETVRRDGSIDWRIVRKIARVRALAERDIDILVAKYGAPIKAPAGVSQHNIAEWRAEAASRVDLAGLKLTPFRKLYRDTLRSTWRSARAIQTVKLSEAKRKRMIAEGASFTRIRLFDMLVGSVRGIKGANEVERV